MILVTGASGFVGRHMVRALKRRFPTESVRALTRTKPSPEVLPEGVEIFIGALEQSELPAAVVQGADVVIHLAARVQPESREITEMRRVNVEGTRKLYSPPIATGCKIFFLISNARKYGPALTPQPPPEQDVLAQ